MISNQNYLDSDDIFEDVVFADEAYEEDDDYNVYNDDDDEGYLEAYDDMEMMDDDDEDDLYDDAFDDDDDFDDDESIDGAEIFGRKRRRRRRRRRRSRAKARRLNVARGKAFRSAPVRPFRNKGRISTPAGQATVKLPKNIATKVEVKKVEQKVLANNKAILKNGKAIVSNGKAVTKNTNRINRVRANVSDRYRVQAKKIKENSSRAAAMQQSMMINSLLGSNDLKQLTIKAPNFGEDMPTKPYVTPTGEATADINAAADYVINVQNSQSDNSNALLAMAMNGGMGGGSKSNDMMMPMMLIAMGDSGNNDNMMLMLAMSMMNK